MSYGIDDLIGSGVDFAFSKAAGEDAQQFAKHMYKHRFQYAVEDLRKAGLNPVLAASSGLGGGSSPTSSWSANTSTKLGEAALRKANVRTLGSAYDKNKADERLANSARARTDQEEEGKRIENEMAQGVLDLFKANPEYWRTQALKMISPETPWQAGAMVGMAAGATPGSLVDDANSAVKDPHNKPEEIKALENWIKHMPSDVLYRLNTFLKGLMKEKNK